MYACVCACVCAREQKVHGVSILTRKPQTLNPNQQPLEHLVENVQGADGDLAVTELVWLRVAEDIDDL